MIRIDIPTGGIADKRGVSEVIGSILVFGLVVSLVSMLQLHAVPNANEEVEYNHNLDVQQDMTRLHESIGRTASRGDGESVSVKLGTSYPTRLLFYNPPPVSGKLTTSDEGTVFVTGALAENEETNDYLGKPNGVTVQTHSLHYRGNYHLYENAPVTGIDNGVLYNEYEQTLVENNGSLVDGKRINIMTLTGDFTKQGVTAKSVKVSPASAPARTVAVTNQQNRYITVEIPTKLSQEVWVHKVLASDIDDDEDGDSKTGTNNGNDGPEAGETCADISSSVYNTHNDRYVVACSWTAAEDRPDSEYNSLMLTFEQGVTYDLRMSQVGLGGNIPSPSPAYVTTVEGDEVAIPEGGIQRLVLEVRDKYNTPVLSETVTLHVDSKWGELRTQSGKTGQTVKVQTNADGQAAVIFASKGGISSTTTVPIKASVDADPTNPGFDSSLPRNLKFDVTVNDIGSVAHGEPPEVVEINDVSQVQLSDITGNSFDVRWTADEKNDGKLAWARLRLVNENTNQVVDTAQYDLKGKSKISTTTTLTDQTTSGGNVPYTIELVVVDAEDNRVKRTESKTSRSTI